MELSLQNNEISNDPETKGFSLSAGNTWIYPENYPIRQYQYNIVKSALYENTLVCLPTGLGKTFIAAVLMYNFWRWYPFGKIVFLAPTKPLVTQQIDACYKVMGIPSVDMIELTGAVNQKNRETAWYKKRIIFATPQVFHNDLEKAIVPSHLVKCVVVDEAHKALGKHSYCECIRILSPQNQYFRILALSATPGNKIDNVHEVIQNLHISHLELRDETSPDIMPYVNKRNVDIILVPLSHELATFKDRYIVIMDPHVKFLMQYNVLRAQTANISKGRIFHLLNEFKGKTDKSGNYGRIMRTLNILLTMYHAYELMIRHGLRAFCKFYETHSDKFWMHNENQLQSLLQDIESYLGPFPEILPNGDVTEIPVNLVFGHNKFYKLKELLEHHFKYKNGDRQDTRAIVFVEYREIVNEVYVLLLKSKPVIRPQMFVGQASLKQKQQIKALEDFRSNRVNVLISTSIGEEGLDVGEVDLIICFDVSQHSPIRLVQRMGRTGRKRDGHIIVLVTDGKEHENLKSTLSKRNSLNNKILNTSNIFSSLYENNPRMIPSEFTPECYKMHIYALPKSPNIKGKRKRKENEKKETKKNESINKSTKQKETSSIKKGQPSMMKFLTNSKCNEVQNQNNTCNIVTQLTTQYNTQQSTINSNNVKLLSDDNAGVDFLTLCAVKRSEEEMSSKSVHKMDTTYIPTPKPVEDLFNFVLPDIEVIDNFFMKIKDISIAECKDCEDDLPTQNKNNEDENIHNNDCIDISDSDNNFWCTVRNENIDNNEVRFEDILDESSDSNESTISYLNQEIRDIEINSNKVKDSTSDTKKDNKVITDTGIEVPNNNADLESSLFENILNESFSSIEDNSENENMSRQNVVSTNSPNTVIDVENMNVIDENTVNISHNKDNAKSNSNLSLFMKPAKPNQINKLKKNFIDEIQDFDFNSDDDINEFINHESSRNVSKRNSKAEESLLSITQAIVEIAGKKDLKISSKSSVPKEESFNESIGWISVNTRDETKIEKNTSSKKEIKLSNLFNSAAQSCSVKQDFHFPDDSDEDFMITDDNAKKFNELESCYFRDMSKNWKDESNCMPSTSTNLGNKSNYFDTSDKHSEAKSCYDNTSKNIYSRGTSTPISNRRAGLSLKRNRDQNVDKIDLSLFEAPNRHTNNAKDKSILETSSPTQMFSSDKIIAQKIRHKHKRGKNNGKNEFIDDEAEVDSFCDVSSDETVIMDEDDLADFVSYTQHHQDQVDMQAHYLQTVKSPLKRPGAFHFREPRSPNLNMEIYSQPLSQVQDSYLYDSFCVKEDVEPSMLVDNDTILERAERELKRNRRRRRLCSDKMRYVKRQKTNHSESSEDEIEQLRIQVQD